MPIKFSELMDAKKASEKEEDFKAVEMVDATEREVEDDVDSEILDDIPQETDKEETILDDF